MDVFNQDSSWKAWEGERMLWAGIGVTAEEYSVLDRLLGSLGLHPLVHYLVGFISFLDKARSCSWWFALAYFALGHMADGRSHFLWRNYPREEAGAGRQAFPVGRIGMGVDSGLFCFLIGWAINVLWWMEGEAFVSSFNDFEACCMQNA